MSIDPQRINQMISSHAENAHALNPDISKNQYVYRTYMDRFLCRIFSNPEDSDWILKGGTGIIARVPTGRRTTDIDLYTSGYSLDSALEALMASASIDLDDSFRFQYIKHQLKFDRELQPDVQLYNVTFQILISGQDKGPLNIDLAVGGSPIGNIELQNPEGRLNIQEFITFPYRLFPLEHQIAEKVCAAMSSFGSNQSSREKDLVDLVVIATRKKVNGRDLRRALEHEIKHRGIDLISTFTVPANWGRGYKKHLKTTPAAKDYPEIQDALALMAKFIDPALKQGHSGLWDPLLLEWQ